MEDTHDSLSLSCSPREKQASRKWLISALHSISTSTFLTETSELSLHKELSSGVPPLSKSGWNYLWVIARQHRLIGMLHRYLEASSIDHGIPQPLRAKIARVHQHIQRGNALRFVGCGAILHSFATLEIYPILLKGIALADAFYPDYAMRPMGDIDLLIRPEQFHPCHKALLELKFQHISKAKSADHYVNPLGLKVDLHTEFSLFSNVEQYTEVAISNHIQYPEILRWEPHALVIHLVVHLCDHSAKTGHLLVWIMDLVFVLQRYQEQLIESTLRELFPSPHHMRCFARVLGFIHYYLSVRLSRWQQRWAERFHPYSLDELVLHRQMGIWRLYSGQGWLGMLAERLQLKAPSGRSFPQTTDYLRWIQDLGRRSLEDKRHHYIDRDT